MLKRITVFSLLIIFTHCTMDKNMIEVSSTDKLLEVISSDIDSITVVLRPGDYYLNPTEFIDSTCGNCQDINTLVPATYGLKLTKGFVKLVGRSDGKAMIHTSSGYGIYFENTRKGILENLVITDGFRDTSGMAADAGVVVKSSDVEIRNCEIRDNIGNPLIVVENIVGIMGICGRENANILVEGCKIVRNSWDGIALYRDAFAEINNNIIDGVDKATSKFAGGGRGVAIGVTWNAGAIVKGNLLQRYWKGLGIFIDADVTAQNNIIEEMLTWGIAYWDADQGDPVAVIGDNIIYNTGACGVTLTRSNEGPDPGRLTGNLIVLTGQNPEYDSPDYYCHQCALSVFAKPDNFVIADNMFYDNRRATDDLPDYDSNLKAFKLFVDSSKLIEENKYYKSSGFFNYYSGL